MYVLISLSLFHYAELFWPWMNPATCKCVIIIIVIIIIIIINKDLVMQRQAKINDKKTTFRCLHDATVQEKWKLQSLWQGVTFKLAYSGG